MKMTKLLASGVAASLAVASLASVASATDRTFEMGASRGKVEFSGGLSVELGDKYYLTDEQFNEKTKTLGVSSNDSITVQVANGQMTALTGLALEVTGVKGTRGSASRTYTYPFTANDDGTFTLPIAAGVSVGDRFLPEQFLEITKMRIVVSGYDIYTTAAAYTENEWGKWLNYNALTVKTPFVQSTPLLNEITDLIQGSAYVNNGWGVAINASSATIYDVYPFMAVTDDGDKTLTRKEFKLLSKADHWEATTGGQNASSASGNHDGDQSFEEVDYNKGTNPNDFAGLASQVGDFFNKQTNGKITFKFTTSAGSSSTQWNNGGVPSSQVGIKNALGAATANDFALAFNYTQTGSLQAVAEVNASEGEVSFDISDVLDALDGKTIGVIDNIYYGLTKGVTYADGLYKGLTGFEVQTITLSYDEDDASDTDIEEDDDDTDADDDEDDTDVDDDDDTDADDDDDDDDDGDVSFDDDDDDDDQDVGGANNTPVVDNTPVGSDDNPNTGVALAVVPAMVAAAAVVVSKKRK